MLVNRIPHLNYKNSRQQKVNSIGNSSQQSFTAYRYGKSREFSNWFVAWLRNHPQQQEIVNHLIGIEELNFRERRGWDINAVTEILEKRKPLVDIGTTEIDEGTKYSSDMDYELRHHESTPEPEGPDFMP